MRDSTQEKDEYAGRIISVIVILAVIVLGLFSRMVYLGIIRRDFLVDQSAARSIREVALPAHRGIITDRNGEPLAISIPVASIWINPQLVELTDIELAQLASLLSLPSNEITQKITAQSTKEFTYLKRGIPIETANQIMNLHLPGVFMEKNYKRYYPESDSAAQVVGFTNVDDRGQEGLELAYDSWLRGIPGRMQVLKDRLGNVIANLKVITPPQPGRDLPLSIDRRVQYLAYHELKNTVEKYQADSGSAVVLAVKTGEVLAMVNLPTYNPNNRLTVPISYYRNRAVTDLFEPGSTIKAFSIASALASGKFQPNSLINTNGKLLIDSKHKPIYDDEHINHGVLTVTEVLQKSSDIGVAKMTLALPAAQLLTLLQNVGFSQSTQSGFPGEAVGVLPNNLQSRPYVLATLSFGYSISVTTLQLAQAYSVIASGGLLRPITFIKNGTVAPGKQVLAAKIAKQMLAMLETVLDIGGTGTQAQITGYRVAGKTGTAHIAAPGGYYADRYFSLFAGIAPVADPQLVVVVVVRNPHGQYKGGKVAAPVFSAIMEGALRILGIPPDDVNHQMTED